MKIITEEGLNKANEKWKPAHLSTVMANKITTFEHSGFDTANIQGTVTTTKPIMIQLLSFKQIKDVTQATGYTMRVNVITKPLVLNYSDSLANTSTYIELKPGSCQVGVCLHTLSSRKV